MQVNLSTTPVLLHVEGQPARFQSALAAAIAHTGLQVVSDWPEDAKREALAACLQNLHDLVRHEGPAQSTAAAALLTLALSGAVLLPAGGPSLRALLPAGFPFRLPTLVQEVDDYVKKESPRWLGRDTHLQLLLATDCRNAKDFDIFAFADLHTWLVTQGIVESKLSLANAPYVLLRGIEQATGATLGRDLRHGYIFWRASEADKAMSLQDFLADPKNMAGMRVHGHERERIELQTHVKRRHERASQRAAKAKAERPLSPFVQNLERLAGADTNASAEEYFAALTGSSNVKGFRPDFWLDEPVNYPGRGHIDVAELGKRWFLAFRAFLAHRQKDYETDKQVRSALTVLADYVLLYLPWWLEKHPATTIVYPESPKQFLRYFFFDRARFHSDEKEALGELPKPLNEMLTLRRPTPGARNSTRISLHKFFGFVLTYFEDNADYVSKGMQNPIRPDFDNEVSGRPTKTNKVPFAEDVFPFLVQYGQAVEAFGEYLQQIAYERNAFRELPNGPRDGEGYDTTAWGYVPVFWRWGRLHRVEWLPSIYLIAKRVIQSNPVAPNGIYVGGQRINVGASRNVTLNFPHLTVVRLLMAMVETGARGQSVQWLDRRSFDKLAKPLSTLAELYGSARAQGFHPLYINTDKTHDPWSNVVAWRVRRSLLAERYFQESVVDEHIDKEVLYEEREATRFTPLLPLFRSNLGPKPVSDTVYSNRWVEFLYGFQTFYNRKDGVDRSDTADALEVVRERDDYEDGSSLYEMYLAIHTPHACRATYATLKDGELDVSEISEQLGHANTTVTNTYKVPQLKRLTGKLKAIDDEMMGTGAYDASGTGPAFLHPEREGSSVRVAFEKSRDQAMADFGFVPGVALWSLSELDGDTPALELLRQGPASSIRWHPTHVCPVGNQCPKEVVANAGAMSRCGICPLAAKCIDHLPAIEAKQAELHERIQASGARLRAMTARDAPQTEHEGVHREMVLDTKELLGWKLSAEILRARQRELGPSSTGYHVDQPELVRKQLELVTRNTSDSEFFLQRIADSNAYPSLESAEVRAKAVRYTRLILAKQGRLEEAAFLDVPAHSELTVFASMLKPYVDAKQLSLEQVAAAMDELPRLTALPAASATPLLPRD